MIRTIIFLLITTAAFGQSKTRQVDEALGTRIREIPQAGEQVEYVFQVGRKDQSYHRQGDGKSEYTSLLQQTNGIGQFNDQGGQLLYIKKGGQVVARGSAVGSVSETVTRVKYSNEYTPSTTGDPVRPRSLALEPVEQPGVGMSFPDSMEMAQRLDGYKVEITGWKAKLWQSIAPVWDFFMWLFSSLAVFLVCCIFIFRYVAKTAANESLVSVYGQVLAGRWIVTIQQNAAALTLVSVWIIAVVLLINAFLWMVWADLGLWLMVPLAAVLTWFADRVTDWLVPNLRVTGGGGRGIVSSPYN